jgi:hypothetical protein
MLLVPTYVDRSSVEGLGLFAAEAISAGTRVYVWDARFAWSCTPEELASLPETARAFVDRYGWRDRETGLWRASLDNSRFLNHSFAANTEHRADGQYSARDIARGEEITENYSDFDPDFAEYAHTLVPESSAGPLPPRATLPLTPGVSAASESGGEDR